MTNRDALATFLAAVGDDDFVLGHRLSDWVGLGPTMEEDNALASVCQDELGHARLWYEAIVDRELALPQDVAPAVARERGGYDLDDLALNRAPDARRNSTLVEPKHDDYADVIAIGFLYHEAERLLLEALRAGEDADLAGRAEQALNEEPFHREHADLWLDRLVATDEGRRRLERAFSEHLPAAADLFAFPDAVVGPLVESGVLARAPAELREEWEGTIRQRLAALPLEIDDGLGALIEAPAIDGRRGEHTDELDGLLEEIHAGTETLVGDHPVTRYEVP